MFSELTSQFRIGRKKSLNCEIKSRNNLFFIFVQLQKRASIEIKQALIEIKLNINTFLICKK